MPLYTRLLFAAAFALAAFSAFAQPDNNDCTSATLLSVSAENTCSGSTAGTTVDATSSGNACNAAGSEVWYRFVATASAQTLTLSNVVYAGTIYPAYFTVEIISGSCSDQEHLFCSPWYDSGHDIPFGDLTPGQTYYVAVSDPYSSGIDFEICVSTPPPPPANDACGSAAMLDVDPDPVVDNPQAGTTLNATISPVPVCNDCYWAYDVWYTFTATQANHTVQLSDIVSVQNPSEPMALVYQVYSGTCGDFTLLLNGTVYSNGQFTITNLLPGVAYTIRLHSNNYQVPAQFSIGVSSPPPPVNDECSGALPIPVSSGLYCENYFEGNTDFATGSEPNCTGGVSNDTWYQFTATSVSHRLQIYFGTNDNPGFEVYAGQCGSLTSLACQTVAAFGPTSTILNNLSIGSTYYMRIFSRPNSPTGFYGCLQTLPPPPANDVCSNSEPLPVNPDVSCNQQVYGSTLGATGTDQNCLGTSGVHDVWYSFIATQSTHRLAIGLNYPIFGDYYNLGYEVVGGADCNSLSSIVCHAEYGVASMLSGLTPGATYFVRVYSDKGSAHAFYICLQSPPPPPVNGSCGQATMLTPAVGPACDSQTSGSTAGVLAASSSTCYFSSGMEVWYSFTATSANHIVRVSDVQQLYGNGYDYSLELYSGTDCDNRSYLNCYTYPGTVLLGDLIVGQTYWLRWLSAPYSAHSFNICIGTLQPPANDACSNAVPLTVNPDLNCAGPTSGTLAGSTLTLPVNCLENPDVWYTFVATQASQQAVLSNVIDIIYGYYQPIWAELLTGDCGNLTSVQCWSDPNNSSGYLTFGELVPGQTYYLRIASAYNSALNFDICIQTPPPPPVNDACANATPLVPQETVTCAPVAGTTQNATSSPGLPILCCGAGDVWYSFVATQANNAITLSNVMVDGYPTSAMVELYSSACGNFVLMGSQFVYDNFSWYRTDFVPGATYHVRVLPAYSQRVDFEICVAAIPAPSNDECANALPMPTDLNCSNTLSVMTQGATQSLPECNGVSQANDLWYQFTATAENYRFDVAVQTGSQFELGYELFSGPCSALVSVQCGFLNNSIFTVNGLTIGDTYYMRWFSGQNSNHNFSVCARPLPPAPANDACSGAFPIIVAPGLDCDAPATGTTISADQSANSCYGYPGQDVWYSFVATNASHLLNISATHGYFGGLYDLGFQVYSGDCDNLVSLVCQDYLYQPDFVLSNLTAGQTYYIRVYSQNNNAHDFSLCVLTLPPPPANDECVNATPVLVNALVCDHSYPGTTLGANPENYSNGSDVWYSFTATSTTHLFDLLNINQVLGALTSLNYDVYQSYQGGGCAALNFLANFSAGNTGFLNYLQPGETYYIRVYSGDPNAAHTFELCIKTLPPSPVNEDCSGAIVLTPNPTLQCNIVTAGTTAGAINSNGPSCGYGYDVWYQFTATSNNHWIQASNITTVVGSGGLWVDVLQGENCDNLYHLNCAYFDQTIQLNGLTPGNVYYVKVTSQYYSAHNYDLCLSTLPPPPNDQCVDALPVGVSADAVCTTGVSGATLGANPSDFPTCSNFGNDVWYSFTATQAAHTVSIDNVREVQGGWAGYFGVEVYHGTCGSLQNLACRSGLYYSDLFTVGELTAGEVYSIRIFSYYAPVTFDLCVTTPPPPPANDACVNATVLSVSPTEICIEATPGTTENATPTGGGTYTPGYNTLPNDVWYTFAATQTDQIVTLNNLGNPSYVVIAVYSGSCGALSTPITQFYSGSNPLVLPLNGLTPGTNYYLKVFDYYNQPLDFDICVTTPQPDPAVSYVYPYANPCATDNETVLVVYYNQGLGPLPAGEAQYTLTVSGANTGTYGPFTNAVPLTGSGEAVYFTGVDLSNSGLSVLTATVVASNDAGPGNNSASINFTTLPKFTFYRDADTDGYGDPEETTQACYGAYGYVSDHTDCDDANPWVHPGASEFCNGLDDDCDGLLDTNDPGILDTLAPVINCPANMVVNNAPGTCSAVVNYTVTASDECTYTLTQTGGLASGASFPVGTTLNEFIATDPGGNHTGCSFTIQVKKTGDPNLLYAYTIIGFNEVFLKKNTVQSGGVGVVKANKKVRLHQGTLVTAPNTFVKTPVLELQGGSLATTVYNGPVGSGLLPAFQPNNNPGNNNLNIPNNSAPVTLSLNNYGNVTVGKNVTVTFSGNATVRIKELTLKAGSVVQFAQSTTVKIDKTMTLDKNVTIQASGAGLAQFFVEGQVTIEKGCHLTTNLYTLKALTVAKAEANDPTYMTGLFIAEDKVTAEDNVYWNWDAGYCPYQQGVHRSEEDETEPVEPLAFNSGLQLFPNPATVDVRVVFEGEDTGEATVQLFDAMGRLVREETFVTDSGRNEHRLSLEGMPEGSYVVQVQTKGQRYNARLIVMKR